MKRMSALLVTIQLVVLAALALTGPLLPRGVSMAPFAVGIALGLWSVWSMRRSRLRMVPEPHPSATLVTSGPYRWIRHPMYTAVLLVTSSWLVAEPTWLRLAAWLILVLVLMIKMQREETLWTKQFAEYREYAVRTKRLIPGIF
jgi:protein-S-isoprenylcysteine O-methyltransferase Ste14